MSNNQNALFWPSDLANGWEVCSRLIIFFHNAMIVPKLLFNLKIKRHIAIIARTAKFCAWDWGGAADPENPFLPAAAPEPPLRGERRP